LPFLISGYVLSDLINSQLSHIKIITLWIETTDSNKYPKNQYHKNECTKKFLTT